MTRPRLLPTALLLMSAVACSGLSYPTPEPQEASEVDRSRLEAGAAGPDAGVEPEADDLATRPATESPSGPPRPPVLMSLEFGVPEDDLPSSDDRPDADWTTLTREARELTRRGEFDVAHEKLEQARRRLADRPATHAGRQTIFGLQARLAIDLARYGREEDADALAETLFEAARAEPALAGPALVDLAYSTARRRAAAAEEAGRAESQLPLFRITLDTAENASPSRRRLQIAYEIAGVATDEADHDLARRAIDRAVLDAQVVAPGDLLQLGTLKVYKARIARAQGDLVTAEASARSALRLFEEARADDRNRTVAEATLARILGEAGDLDGARALAEAGLTRIEQDPSLPDYVRRMAIGAMARVEHSAGDRAAARARYRQALAVPPVDFEPDRELIVELSSELAALRGDASAEPPAPSTP